MASLCARPRKSLKYLRPSKIQRISWTRSSSATNCEPRTTKNSVVLLRRDEIHISLFVIYPKSMLIISIIVKQTLWNESFRSFGWLHSIYVKLVIRLELHNWKESSVHVESYNLILLEIVFSSGQQEIHYSYLPVSMGVSQNSRKYRDGRAQYCETHEQSRGATTNLSRDSPVSDFHDPRTRFRDYFICEIV